jgi:hypothetical protein
MIYRHLSLILGLVLFLTSGCVTTSGEEPVKPENVEIADDMKVEDALKAAIDHGGVVIDKVRKLVTRRKEWPVAQKLLAQALRDGTTKFNNAQLVNTMGLYLTQSTTPDPALFEHLVTSGRPAARQLGWHMAATLPSAKMARAIERELTRALAEDSEKDVLIPEMADAVRANGLASAYTFVRRGLMESGSDSFAAAMVSLNPSQASSDFMDYLALAQPEDLRQLSITTVNMVSATIALNHLRKYPVSLAHPSLEHLYYYAVSRNPGLAELAQSVIEAYASTSQSYMAQLLARLPAWVQIAYVESTRRNMNASRRALISELRRLSAQQEVLEEIDDIR